MLGPTFGHTAASITGLLLIEKLAMEWLFPPWIPTIEDFEARVGKSTAVGIMAVANSTITFWGIGLLFALPPLLGWRRWKIQQDRSLDMKMLKRSLPLIAFNFVLQVVVGVPFLIYLLPASSLDWHALPSTETLARDITVWLLVEEVCFFYVHRWLHQDKRMYAAVHKLHHTWTAPISIVAIYCHPFEHLVSNIIPVLLGPLICRSHAASFGVFLSVGTVHTLAVHSGYWFCDDNGMHDEHHAKFNVNFGVTGMMDKWYGTYQLPAGARPPAPEHPKTS